MNISQRLRTCARHTGLDAVIELLNEAADEIDSLQARAQVQGEVLAWCTPDGERCVTAKTMAGANKDGGAMLSSLGAFTVPLYSTTQPAQATQAEVTDERILEIGREWTKEVGWYEFEVNDFIGCARAILALRPVQVPMTDEQLDAVMRKALGYGLSPSRDDLEFARAVEVHHGITAQAKKETP